MTPVDRPRRILLSLHQGGGAGSVNSVLRLGFGLRERGLLVRFVCPPGSEVEADARAGGLEVHPVPLAKGQRFGNAARLRALLTEFPVDLINSHGSRDREALTWLGMTRRFRVPVVFTRRSFPRTTRLENWMASRVATRVVAISEPVAEALRRLGTPARKLAVIENGLLLDRIDGPVAPPEVQSWRERIRWEPSRRVVAVVARPKDQAVLLQALPLVETPLRLVLAGLDGAALTDPLPEIPERHAVIRLPFDRAIRPFYELVELAVHPSRWDALPQAVLEAMALGKPVIASRATGNAVIIRDGTDGLLVEPMNRAAWAAAIDRVLRDPGLGSNLGAAARIRAREGFPFARTVEHTLELFSSLWGAGAPR